jgi:hypothetical protein
LHNSDGGGISCLGRNIEIANCLIAGNFSKNYGGGVSITGRNCIIHNCTITDNTAQVNCGGGIDVSVDNLSITNCIIWGNSAPLGKEVSTYWYDFVPYEFGISLSYCNVREGEQGIALLGSPDFNLFNWGPGNIDAEPYFVDAGNGDYHLKSQGMRWDRNGNQWTRDEVTSRCIDAGNPGCVPGDEPMPHGRNRINMGAYGGTSEASTPPEGWALLGDLTNDGIVNFEDFMEQSINWSNSGNCQPGDLNRDGAVNIADVRVLAEDWLGETGWRYDS